MTTESIVAHENNSEAKLQFNLQPNEPKDKTDEMVNEIINLNLKDNLKQYLHKAINQENQSSFSIHFSNQQKEKMCMIQQQIKSGIENANELNKTLTVAKSAKEKETNRAQIKIQLSKQAKELLMQIAALKNQIEIEKKNDEEYKRILFDQQQDI